MIKVPALARVPQGPTALLGVANLRGVILPLASLHVLLGKLPPSDLSAARAIVLDIGAPVSVLVDSVATLEAPNADQVDTQSSEVSAQGPERLLGVFPVGREQRVAKILDIRTLLDGAFANRTRTQRRDSRPTSVIRGNRETARAEQTENLVTFDVGNQEYGLPLADVQEILPTPDSITALAHAETVVLGMTSVRNTLLPLLSLRALLGFTEQQHGSADHEKVLVVKIGDARVGLVADRARAIVAAESANIDPVPLALAARTGGESRIKSIYRGEEGRRLISILSPQQLFRDDVMQRLIASTSSQGREIQTAGDQYRKELIALVFRLGDDEFGLPIDAVVEVAQVPEQITRVPKTPKFLEGVVNLRGEVLPVVDQRRRFDMPPQEGAEARRLIVVKTQGHRAGLIVDSVRDVLRAHEDDLAPAPELTDEISKLVRGVINLTASSRIVLLLDPTELLTRAERGLLDKFKAQHPRKEE